MNYFLNVHYCFLKAAFGADIFQNPLASVKTSPPHYPPFPLPLTFFWQPNCCSIQNIIMAVSRLSLLHSFGQCMSYLSLLIATAVDLRMESSSTTIHDRGRCYQYEQPTALILYSANSPRTSTGINYPHSTDNSRTQLN